MRLKSEESKFLVQSRAAIWQHAVAMATADALPRSDLCNYGDILLIFCDRISLEKMLFMSEITVQFGHKSKKNFREN